MTSSEAASSQPHVPPPPAPAPAVAHQVAYSTGDLWTRFITQLNTRGRRFDDVAQATDRAAVLRACGLHDALDLATLETEWASRMKATGDSATDTLKTYFATAEQRTLEPWRVEDQRLQAERNAVKAMTLREVQDAFLEAAKNATLTPDEVMTGTYLLFADTEAAKQFGMMVLQRRGLARVRAHNSFVLEHMEAALSSANASRIAALNFPLFPPTKGFNGLNARLLIETESDVMRETIVVRGMNRSVLLYRVTVCQCECVWVCVCVREWVNVSDLFNSQFAA